MPETEAERQLADRMAAAIGQLMDEIKASVTVIDDDSALAALEAELDAFERGIGSAGLTATLNRVGRLAGCLAAEAARVHDPRAERLDRLVEATIKLRDRWAAFEVRRRR